MDNNSNYTTLLEKVAAMRELQKRYFKFREPDILRECKAAEKEIDALIAGKSGKPAVKEIEHPKLF